MKSFWLNAYSGRHERWAVDGHRWVAAEPRGKTKFDLWGYQDDTPEIVYLGRGANEERLELKATAVAAAHVPKANASFAGDSIVQVSR
jgi:hypothetical protein